MSEHDPETCPICTTTPLDFCLCCYQHVRTEERIPGCKDDAAWARIAADFGHAPGCEWVETRAHTKG